MRLHLQYKYLSGYYLLSFSYKALTLLEANTSLKRKISQISIILSKQYQSSKKHNQILQRYEILANMSLTYNHYQNYWYQLHMKYIIQNCKSEIQDYIKMILSYIYNTCILYRKCNTWMIRTISMVLTDLIKSRKIIFTLFILLSLPIAITMHDLCKDLGTEY